MGSANRTTKIKNMKWKVITKVKSGIKKKNGKIIEDPKLV